jgi:hypothetical protein
MHGSSSCGISSSVKVTSTTAAASARWCGFVAPTRTQSMAVDSRFVAEARMRPVPPFNHDARAPYAEVGVPAITPYGRDPLSNRKSMWIKRSTY